MKINLILRLVTLVLLIIWRVYWFMLEKKAAITKPKTDNDPKIKEQILNNLTATYLFVSLLGLVIFPFQNMTLNIFGFILVVCGFIEAIIARKTLDDNWTDSYEFQIKKDHELITKGIYGYVRHPIYGAILLMFPGALMVAGSYTFILAFIIMVFVLNAFARREEKLLTKHFGNKYIKYIKTTKKFIPFIY